MRIMWNNLVDIATLSSCSENPNYSLANVKEWQLSSRFQAVGNNAETITIDCLTPCAVSRFAIIGHNLSASATITLQANTTDSWTTPAWSATVTRRSYAIIHRFTEVSYRYWRVVITDTGVSAIRISRLFLGTFLQLPGMKKDQELTRNTTGESIISDTGQAFPSGGYMYRTPKINFPYLTHAQRTELDAMWQAVGNEKPVLLTVWDDREDLEQPVYCIIDQKEMTFKRNDEDGFPWGTSLKIREVF